MSRSVNLEQALELYLSKLRRQEKPDSTIEAYEGTIRQAVTILQKIGVNKILYVGTHHIERLFYDEKVGWSKTDPVTGRKLAPATENNYRQRMKVFFKWAQSQNLIDADPMTEIDLISFLPSEKLRLGYSKLQEFLDSAKHPRDRVLLALAIFTGLRIGEILSLVVGSVDFENQELATIHHKTKRRMPKPAYRELLREISAWLVYYESHAGQLSPDMYLVPRVDRPTFLGNKVLTESDSRAIQPYKRYTSQGATTMLRDLMVKCLGGDVVGQKWHIFRRTAGRLMYDRLCQSELSRDKALRMVQTFYGHSTRAITEAYLGLEVEQEEMAREVKDQSFFPEPPEPAAADLPANVVPLRSA